LLMLRRHQNVLNRQQLRRITAQPVRFSARAPDGRGSLFSQVVSRWPNILSNARTQKTLSPLSVALDVFNLLQSPRISLAMVCNCMLEVPS
jgi:hypothetical protein